MYPDFYKVIVLLTSFLSLWGSCANGNFTEHDSQTVRWVSKEELQLENLHPTAYANGKKFYIGRTTYLDGMIPGKVYSEEDKIFFGYGGKELKKEEYELLVFPRGALLWIEVTNGSNMPGNLFQGGSEPGTLEPLYICRAWHDTSSLVLGKFLHSQKVCRIPCGWNEKLHDHFDILIWSDSANIADCHCESFIKSSNYPIVALLTIIIILLLMVVCSILYYYNGPLTCRKMSSTMRLV